MSVNVGVPDEMPQPSASSPSRATPHTIAGAERCARVMTQGIALLTNIADLRARSELCDVVLVASDDRRVNAHRAVLAAGTPYFRAMFTGGLKESGAAEVRLPGVDGRTLETLVAFIYTGDINVTSENVQVLIASASLLRMDSVMGICCDFLTAHLDAANCLGVVSLAQVLALPALQETAAVFAESHFAEVAGGDEYLELPEDLLAELLTRDGLVVRSETEVFDACIRWLKHQWPERARSAAAALRCVRWPCVPASTLACLDCDEELQFLRELAECATLLQYAKWGEWHAMGQRHRSWRRLRRSVACRGVVFAMGGETNPGRNIVSDAEKFDSQVGSWERMSPIAPARRGAAAVIADNVIYLAGGSDGFNALADVLSYDPETNAWLDVARMQSPRSSVGAVAVAGHTLVFVGGHDGLTTCLHSAESYDVRSGQQLTLAHMGERRSMCAVALFAGRVYAIGGYDGYRDLSSVERYDKSTDEWSAVASMNKERSMAAAAVVSDRLFVVGGSSGLTVFSSAEVYEPGTNAWTTITAMSSARSGLGVAVLSGSLYVLGGYDGTVNLSSVESYEEETQEWTPQPPMLIARRRFSCCCQVT